MYELRVNDLRIRYTGCYIDVPASILKQFPHAAKIGVMLDDYLDDEGGPIEDGRISDVVRAYMSITTKTDDNQSQGKVVTVDFDELDFTKRAIGAVNTKHSAIIIHSQVPEGNAKYRSLHHEGSLSLIDPMYPIRRYLDLRVPTELREWHMLNAWYDNEFPTADEALTQIQSGHALARAFSGKFIFAISMNTPNTVLMYYDKVIGQVINGEVVLEKWSIRFKEELQGYGISVGEGV